jgi:cytochrome P450
MSNITSGIRAACEPITVDTREVEEHPHRVFRHFRPLTPFVKREEGFYIAIRAQDVEQLATDPRTRQAETEFVVSRGVQDGPLFDFAKHTMVLSNGTDHRRRRAPLARAFAVKLIEELRPQIRAIADELIDDCVKRGGMSLLSDYCSVLPARIIAQILGLPAADIPEFTRHVYNLARIFTPAFSGEMVADTQHSAMKLMGYAKDLLDDRRRHSQNDFLTSYLEGLENSESLSDIEALAQVVTVIVGGSDTTRTAMAIQLSLLLQHREQWQGVCSNATLIPGAVLESLRYEPSVGSFPRFTLEDVDIDGCVVPRNCTLRLSTLSALRDPARYADPDKFDIARTDAPRRHPVFGAGSHRCLGEALAKAELEEGLAALVTRLPQLELAGEPARIYGSGGIRTIQEMRVSESGDGWHVSVDR